LVSTPTPERIIAFRPSEEVLERLRFLLDKQQAEGINAQESAELDEFGRMNHLMSMLKIRARKKLSEA
jgi:hypothetical protein